MSQSFPLPSKAFTHSFLLLHDILRPSFTFFCSLSDTKISYLHSFFWDVGQKHTILNPLSNQKLGLQHLWVLQLEINPRVSLTRRIFLLRKVFLSSDCVALEIQLWKKWGRKRDTTFSRQIMWLHPSVIDRAVWSSFHPQTYTDTTFSNCISLE